MKTTVTLQDFREAFKRMGRTDQFSYEGLEVLFDYLEQYEDDTGEELELDVVALCCEYYEDTVVSIAYDYSIDMSEADTKADDYEEQCLNIVREFLQENGAYVGEVTGGFIYRAF